MYCSTIFLGDKRQYCQKKLQDIQDRARKIVFGIKNTNTWIPIQDRRQMISMSNVFKCIHGLLPSPFDDTLTRLNHKQNTRGNKLNLAIPTIRTEAGKKSFAYQLCFLTNFYRNLRKNIHCFYLNPNLDYIILNFLTFRCFLHVNGISC